MKLWHAVSIFVVAVGGVWALAGGGPGPPVNGVVFSEGSVMSWDPSPGALGYNVYLQEPSYQSGPHCLHSLLPEPTVEILFYPPDEIQLFQVTALFVDGEGSMGTTSAGAPRVSAAPCACTLPADNGPCDGNCGRWFYNLATSQCDQFIWGCCQGNANNFESQPACEAACPP